MLSAVIQALRRISGVLRLRRETPRSLRASDPNAPNDPTAWANIYASAVTPVKDLRSPIAAAIAQLTEGNDLLLEAGCGSAELSAQLATVGRRIALADFSQPILDRAANLFHVSGLPEPLLYLCDLTRPLPLESGAVDAVWSSGVLEHWTDEALVPIVREMARVSRKTVISLVPNASCVLYRLGKHVAEQTGEWPYGQEIPRESLRPVFNAAGLKNIREWDLQADDAAGFLNYLSAQHTQIATRWWCGLDSSDPLKRGQGYLLLTVGHHANTTTVSTG